MDVALEMVETATRLTRKERVARFSFINNYKGVKTLNKK